VAAAIGIQVVTNGGVDRKDTEPRKSETADQFAVEEDFAEFYRTQLTVIYRFLRARTPTGQDAEDLVQTVFFKAYRARSGFRGDESARVAWLFRIARNETASWYLSGRHEPVAMQMVFSESWEATDPEPGPEAQALIAEERQALARLVGRLSEDEQELVQLRFAAGLTSVQIAVVLGCSSGAARQRLHRVIDRLREWSDHELR